MQTLAMKKLFSSNGQGLARDLGSRTLEGVLRVVHSLRRRKLEHWRSQSFSRAWTQQASSLI